jgi:hypothetical protein
MATVTFSISTAKLQYAIAFTEGLKSGNPKVTDGAIDKALTELGYTAIELVLIKSTETSTIVEAVFNPPIHHRTGKGRKKAEVKTTLPDANEPPHGWDSDVDETLGDENVLGV